MFTLDQPTPNAGGRGRDEGGELRAERAEAGHHGEGEVSHQVNCLQARCQDNSASSTHTKRLKALDGIDSHVSRPHPSILKSITYALLYHS